MVSFNLMFIDNLIKQIVGKYFQIVTGLVFHISKH